MKSTSYLLSLLVTGALVGGVFADDDDRDEAQNPGAPSVRVSASDPVAFRGVSSGAFVLSRGETNGDLAVKITFSGTASNGVDYATLPSSVTIPAGFRSVGLKVDPIGSGSSVPNEWVTLTIQTNTNYNVGRPAKSSVLIKGNELENQAPSVRITAPAD
ncbi:MAG TPA: hypothetical protein VK633_09000, partial [Verrucomicrobiae bacterium]|nr:hypothetical protein [Verrucomicrobiae bacterium]